MKILFIISLLFSGTSYGQPGIYKLKLKTLEGQTIYLENYKGKKIFIASCTMAEMQTGSLAFLDSFQIANPAITVIAIPTMDINDSTVLTNFPKLKNTSGRHLLVMEPARINKVTKSAQNSFLEWFAGNNEGMHFEPELTTRTRFMVISESGILYALLEKGVSNKTINEVIQQRNINN
jgi:hypothetical protein